MPGQFGARSRGFAHQRVFAVGQAHAVGRRLLLARPTGTKLSHPEPPYSGARGAARGPLYRRIPSDQGRPACPLESAHRTASSLPHEQRSEVDMTLV